MDGPKEKAFNVVDDELPTARQIVEHIVRAAARYARCRCRGGRRPPSPGLYARWHARSEGQLPAGFLPYVVDPMYMRLRFSNAAAKVRLQWHPHVDLATALRLTTAGRIANDEDDGRHAEFPPLARGRWRSAGQCAVAMNTRADSRDLSAWERAEIARSQKDALALAGSDLRLSTRTVQRYCAPPADTAYPLEYAFHRLGDVHGKSVLVLGCGCGKDAGCLASRDAHVLALDISEELVRTARRRLAAHGLSERARGRYRNRRHRRELHGGIGR